MPLFWARCRSTSGQSRNIISKSRTGLSSDRLCIRRGKIIEPLPLAITISLISSVSSHRRATRKWHFKSYSSSYWGGGMPQRARELRVIKMSFSCTLSRGTTAADATRCDLLELPSSYHSPPSTDSGCNSTRSLLLSQQQNYSLLFVIDEMPEKDDNDKVQCNFASCAI